MIFFVVLLVLIFLAQVAQIFIPPLAWMIDARVYIVPVIVFYGALALPVPAHARRWPFSRGFMLGRADRAGSRTAS